MRAAKLNRQHKEFGAILLQDTIEPDRVEAYQQKKADLQEEIVVLKKRGKD